MELSYWTGTEFKGGAYNESEERWSVVLHRADGTKREIRPRHVVMATGASGIANVPDLPMLGNLSGKILHSSQYDDVALCEGKQEVVYGSGEEVDDYCSV